MRKILDSTTMLGIQNTLITLKKNLPFRSIFRNSLLEKRKEKKNSNRSKINEISKISKITLKSSCERSRYIERKASIFKNLRFPYF